MISLAKTKFSGDSRIFVMINLIFGLIAYCLYPNSASANCIGLYSIVPVNFGTYNPSSGNNLTSTGNININNFTNCINLLQPTATNFTIKFSTGLSGNYSSRKMTNPLFPTIPLQYNLYTSVNNATIWGNGTGGSGTVSQTGTSNINIPIYGVVPARQNASIGSYSDSITVTIEFN